MNAAPVSKLDIYGAQLRDRSLSLSLIELRRIIADCKKALHERATGTHDACLAQTLVGCSYTRLGRHQDALDWYKRAIGNLRSVETLTNLGVGLEEVGDAEGALNAWVEAVELVPPGPSSLAVVAFANLAEALMDLGATEDAWDAFQEAVRRADPSSAFDNFVLAHQAGELGADNEAAEFFARHLSIKRGKAMAGADAVTFLRSFPREVIVESFGFASAHMQGAIARAMGDLGLVDLPPVTDLRVGRSEASAAEYAATEASRSRVNSSLLPEHAE